MAPAAKVLKSAILSTQTLQVWLDKRSCQESKESQEAEKELEKREKTEKDSNDSCAKAEEVREGEKCKIGADCLLGELLELCLEEVDDRDQRSQDQQDTESSTVEDPEAGAGSLNDCLAGCGRATDTDTRNMSDTEKQKQATPAILLLRIVIQSCLKKVTSWLLRATELFNATITCFTVVNSHSSSPIHTVFMICIYNVLHT